MLIINESSKKYDRLHAAVLGFYKFDDYIEFIEDNWRINTDFKMGSLSDFIKFKTKMNSVETEDDTCGDECTEEVGGNYHDGSTDDVVEDFTEDCSVEDCIEDCVDDFNRSSSIYIDNGFNSVILLTILCILILSIITAVVIDEKPSCL